MKTKIKKALDARDKAHAAFDEALDEVHDSEFSDLLCCEDCGKQDDTVRHDICPYASEINDSHIPIVICPDCYHERWMDT